MAQAQHVGKLVLDASATPTRSSSRPSRPSAPRPPPCGGDGSYLVTGGLGGLGLSVAGWLAEQGAGHLVLLGRSGAATPEQRPRWRRSRPAARA